MPEIQPIPAVTYAAAAGEDLSDRLAPPYDVLDEAGKAALLQQSEHNIVAVDLPHLPAKTVGPDATYHQAGERYRRWLEEGVLQRSDTPAMFVYQQTYTADPLTLSPQAGSDVRGRTFQRRGLIANVEAQPFGPSATGQGGVYPHEETFASAKEDRLKLMRATEAQLSPIFGLYSDPDAAVAPLLARVIDQDAVSFRGTTPDGTLHEVWAVDDAPRIEAFEKALGEKDIFIADGHHRYNTALTYKQERRGAGPEPGRANFCLFVLVSMQDPGMIVLPTHRVLGNMPRFDFDAFARAAQGKLAIEPVLGTDLANLEQAVREYAHPHAMGLYNPAHPEAPLAIATTVERDPLKKSHPDKSSAWRQLDVALVQHLIVEQICRPNFCEQGEQVTWKFPHDVDELKSIADGGAHQLGVLLRPTSLEAVREVSEAGELMPQKSTFFYPKLATGLVINSLA